MSDTLESFDPQVETLQCQSRESNPAPVMRWFLGDKELLAASQTNTTEAEDSRKWRATSTLKHKFSKEDFAKLIKCQVEHPAYPTGHQETSVVLDVLCKY